MKTPDNPNSHQHQISAAKTKHQQDVYEVVHHLQDTLFFAKRNISPHGFVSRTPGDTGFNL
jgi:hypothetical protein